METIKQLFAFVAAVLVSTLVGVSVASAAGIGLNLFTIGGTSTTQIIPIFPTWSINVPLPPPTSLTAASSTGGSLNTTGQQFYFRVAASNGTGTTTASSEIATTTVINEDVHLSWSAVPNATSYFVFFSTTTPGTENSYFVATTTNQYDFTSTTSPNIGTIPGFPSSFSAQIGNGATPLTVNNLPFSPIATTTSALGGGALVAGGCATSTSTVLVGSLSSSTIIMTTPAKSPGPSMVWQSYALNSTKIITTVCALIAGTPISTVYNIRAF
jgi:hypothetical protein